MSEVVPPRFGWERSSQMLAWAMSLAVVLLAIWVLVDGGLEALGAALLCAAFAVFVAAAARVEVRATSTDLQVTNLWRTTRIPWSQIEGFRVEDAHGARRVLALVHPDRVLQLPVANGPPLVTRRKEVREIRDRLEEYRSSRA